jgi:radical SAM protein (TIGR01212 family)
MNYIIYMKTRIIKILTEILTSGDVPVRFFRDYLREKFGTRVKKIPVALPFTCPNIDGTKGRGGCIYCFKGSRPAHLDPRSGLKAQIREGIRRGLERYGKKTKFIVYFQSYTNTYSDIETLRQYYDTITEFSEVVGIDVGTRPDCAPDGVLDLLSGYGKRGYEVWIEFGLQSANFETLKRINRQHGVSHLVDAVLRAKRRGLKVCVHTILGLPGEGREDFLETAALLRALEVEGVKIHPIYVMRNTPLAGLYLRGEFRPLSLEEYVSECATFLEHINPGTVVHRLTAEANFPDLLAPDYCTYEKKPLVIASVLEELKRRKSRQGARVERRGCLAVEGTGGHREERIELPG